MTATLTMDPADDFYRIAAESFAAIHQAGWATCPKTQNGAVR
jgi:hypothetical protein